MADRIYVLLEGGKNRTSLETVLRKERLRWEIQLFEAPEEFLHTHRHSPCSLAMADVDNRSGSGLLTHLKEESPGVIRVAMADQFSLHSFLESTPVAHQCLARPFESRAPVRLMDRALRLREELGQRQWDQLFLGDDGLPMIPRLYTRLVCVLASRDPDLDEVTSLIQEDPGICARILRVVNSAYFGLRRELTTVREAVVFLGTRILQELVLSEEVFRLFSVPTAVENIVNELQEHSRRTAAFGMKFFPRRPEGIYLAGVLHEIGTMKVLSASSRDGEPTLDLPDADTRARMTSTLLSLWGITPMIAEAIAHHLTPHRCPKGASDLTAALHLSEELSRQGVSSVIQDLHRGSQLQEEFLESSPVISRPLNWYRTQTLGGS